MNSQRIFSHSIELQVELLFEHNFSCSLTPFNSFTFPFVLSSQLPLPATSNNPKSGLNFLVLPLLPNSDLVIPHNLLVLQQHERDNFNNCISQDCPEKQTKERKELAYAIMEADKLSLMILRVNQQVGDPEGWMILFQSKGWQT